MSVHSGGGTRPDPAGLRHNYERGGMLLRPRRDGVPAFWSAGLRLRMLNVSGERFTILFVCTGNLCRSPMAEAFARHRLNAVLGDEAGDFAVVSAGAQALAGEPPAGRVLDVLDEWGVQPGACSARPLSTGLVSRADLVLTAERAHRGAVVSLVPAAADNTFMLREFARLAENIGAGDLPGDDAVTRAHQLVRTAATRRAQPMAADAHDDEIPDPLSGEVEEFRACARMIERTLGAPLSLLGR